MVLKILLFMLKLSSYSIASFWVRTERHILALLRCFTLGGLVSLSNDRLFQSVDHEISERMIIR